MDRDSVLKLCNDRYANTADYPFTNDFNTAVLRHSDTRKWYAIIMNVPLKTFGLKSDKKVDVINLKVDTLIMARC